MPTPTPIIGGSGDYELTLDFSEAMMVNRPGSKSSITGTCTAEFPAMVLPPGGVLAVHIDGTQGGVRYSLADGPIRSFPYSDVLDALPHPAECPGSSATPAATPGT